MGRQDRQVQRGGDLLGVLVRGEVGDLREALVQGRLGVDRQHITEGRVGYLRLQRDPMPVERVGESQHADLGRRPGIALYGVVREELVEGWQVLIPLIDDEAHEHLVVIPIADVVHGQEPAHDLLEDTQVRARCG